MTDPTPHRHFIDPNGPGCGHSLVEIFGPNNVGPELGGTAPPINFNNWQGTIREVTEYQTTRDDQLRMYALTEANRHPNMVNVTDLAGRFHAFLTGADKP